MLNNNHLLEVLFSPEYVLDVMGALECKSLFVQRLIKERMNDLNNSIRRRPWIETKDEPSRIFNKYGQV